MQNYYYRDNAGKEIGPFDLATLAKFRQAGVLNGDTSVRLADSQEWKSCREVVPDVAPITTPGTATQPNASKTASDVYKVLLAVAAVIIFVTWQINNAKKTTPDDTEKQFQNRMKSEVSNPNVQHSAEAEQSYRKQLELYSNGNQFKLVTFKATSGEPFFKTNSFNTDVVESYKLNFEAEMEFEKDVTENGVAVHQGDHAIYTGTMIGSETKDGWVFRLDDTLHILSASNPSLFSKLKDIEDTNRRATRDIAQANACINNLRQIDAAANQFALENKKMTGDFINFPSDLTPYIKLTSEGKIPACPAGGIYTINRVGDTPTCSLGNTVTPNHVLP